jgi:peptide/nickel transport system permease protein
MKIPKIFERILILFLVLWLAATVNFFVPRLVDKNPIRERLTQMAISGNNQQGFELMVAAYEEKFGLDQPLWKQYLNYMNDMLHLDFGYSFSSYPMRVSEQIANALPWTIGLLASATVIAFLFGSLLGALISWPGSPRFLNLFIGPLMVLAGIPYYLFGLILIYFLGVNLNIFPVYGAMTPGMMYPNEWARIVDIIKHSILPALSIVLASAGSWALNMRGMMVTIQGEDYMVNAEAKGLSGKRRFLAYGVRNALLPQVTNLALSLGFVVSGSILVEMVFGYPGMGALLSSSIKLFDYQTLYGVVFIIILAISLSTFVLDLIYPILDPRIASQDR